MAIGRIFVCIILIGTIPDVIAQNKPKETCGVQTSSNQYPWLVGIEYEDAALSIKQIECTGALISRKHVVSNAECYDIPGLAKSVHLGLITSDKCSGGQTGVNCTEGGVIIVPIEKIIKHPEYGGGQHDISLIELREQVQYTDVIQPICLPAVDVTRSVLELELYYAGLDYSAHYIKLHAAATYLDTPECLNFNYINSVAEDEICVKSLEVIRNCLMYGGILMNKRADVYELIGVIGHRSRCENNKVFTYVYPYLEWIRSEVPEWTHECGKRKVKHVELIEHGQTTKAGDWPWHVAIYKLFKSNSHYICGGTLISKTIILTAAHCATLRGQAVDPNSLRVVLGKHYLVAGDVQSQEREVHSVIVHENFELTNYLNNDIALLKLKTEAKFSDYIQTACIWYSEAHDRLPNDGDLGMVIGWGKDQSEELSSQLKQANIPKVSYETCVEKDPLYYVKVLKNKKKFCAGWANGTSPCNGDSGGGFFVFVPDTAKTNTADALGSWYIRGIVSMTVSIRISPTKARCDPYKYVVFTDVEKYAGWIQRYLEN